MDDFYVLLGRNTVSAAGSIEELRGVKLDMKLDAPGLLNTIPGLKGRAKGNVHVDGSLANPVILADLKAEKLATTIFLRSSSLASMPIFATLQIQMPTLSA